MKLKILIVAALLISVVTSMIGCGEDVDFDGLWSTFGNEYVSNGVTYERHYNNGVKYYTVNFISGKDGNREVIYIPDEVDGGKVIGVRSSFIRIVAVERIYFPWSIESSPVENIYYTKDEKTTPQYIISATTTTLIDTKWFIKFAIPRILYDSYTSEEEGLPENVVPANVSYTFNYEGAPNNGIYFVDLLEESGKLNEPPYEPKRTGYDFKGWFKDVECKEAWDFDTSVVNVDYDENGNRVYEEIVLYAKWMRKF